MHAPRVSTFVSTGLEPVRYECPKCGKAYYSGPSHVDLYCRVCGTLLVAKEPEARTILNKFTLEELLELRQKLKNQLARAVGLEAELYRQELADTEEMLRIRTNERRGTPPTGEKPN
jgi:hypothetical protein